MADEKIVIQIQDQIAPSIIKKLKEIADYAQAGQDALKKLVFATDKIATANLKGAIQQERFKKAMADSISASNRSAISASRLQREHAKLSDSTNKVTISTNRAKTSIYQLDKAQSQAALSALRLQDAQARKAKQAAAEAAPKGGGGASSLVGMVKGAVGAYLGIQGVQEIVGLSSAYTDLQNKLKMVTESEGQLAAVTQRVFEIANKTRVPVEDTAKAFVRFDLALQQMGVSQNDTLRMTETVNKMLVISGASAGEAGSSLLQLSQAFNKGKLDGDEFRSVMELMPPVADAIAKKLGVTRGELLKLAPEGKITSKIMYEALASVADGIDEKFGKTIPTIGQALIQLRNTAVQVFGEIGKESGAMAGIADAIGMIGPKLKEVQPELVALISSITDIIKHFSSLSDLFDGKSIQGYQFKLLNTILRGVADTIGLIVAGLKDIKEQLSTGKWSWANVSKMVSGGVNKDLYADLQKSGTLAKLEQLQTRAQNLSLTDPLSQSTVSVNASDWVKYANETNDELDKSSKKLDEIKGKYQSITDMIRFTSQNAPEYLPPRGAESFIGNMNAGVTFPGAEPSMFTDLGAFGFSSEVIEASKVQFTTLEEQYQAFYDQIGIMRAMNVIDDKKAEEMKARFAREKAQERLGYTSEVLGNLSTLMQSSSKDAFRVGKAAAMAQAGIDASGAILKALNSPPGGIGSTIIAASIGAAAAVQMANIAQQQPPGFKEGGFTGYGGTSAVAGVVHGGEFVSNAATTARYRPMLERMQKGQSAVSVTIENYGTSKDFEVEQVTPDQIRIIARDEVRSQVPSLMASEGMNPNSKFSKAMQNSTNLQRKRV